MSIVGIESLVYGAADVATASRFFEDFGLAAEQRSERGTRFRLAEGSAIDIRSADDATLPPPFGEAAGLRELVWGVDRRQALDAIANDLASDRQTRRDNDGTVHTTDDAGIAIAFRLYERTPPVDPAQGRERAVLDQALEPAAEMVRESAAPGAAPRGLRRARYRPGHLVLRQAARLPRHRHDPECRRLHALRRPARSPQPLLPSRRQDGAPQPCRLRAREHRRADDGGERDAAPRLGQQGRARPPPHDLDHLLLFRVPGRRRLRVHVRLRTISPTNGSRICGSRASPIIIGSRIGIRSSRRRRGSSGPCRARCRASPRRAGCRSEPGAARQCESSVGGGPAGSTKCATKSATTKTASAIPI